MLFLSRRSGVLLAAIVVWSVSPPAWADSLLLNGGFDTPTPGLSPPNYPASISGAGIGGSSSAVDWTLYNNFSATTSTELLPTTDPSGSGSMIHLTSTPTANSFSFFNGLQQAFPVQSGGTASVDVNVLSGQVLLALYANNGATYLGQATSRYNNQWETLTVTAPAGSNPDLVVIYTDNGTANTVGEFYADGGGVAAVPEPGSGMLALVAVAVAASVMWNRRPRLPVRKTRPTH